MGIKLNKTGLDISKGIFKGITKGGLVGGVASIVTGAAVITSAPAWLPIIGGTMAVSAATLATWSAIGASVGATSGGIIECVKAKKRKRVDKNFEKHFAKNDEGYRDREEPWLC